MCIRDRYNKGELVEPIKPIIYYLDPATPLKWRPYFKKGIEDWNIAFEKAGFKNAIIAKDPPSNEINPDFSPEDIRFSTVRYVASKTRNASGPSVSDPRTGEILESDIIWYHNHLRSYRNRYLLETGAANPDARTLNTPESEIGEMMRRVISHEIGHALITYLFDDMFDLQRVTINANKNGAGGYTLFTPNEEYDNFQTKKFMLANLLIAMGGRAAEQILFEICEGFFKFLRWI